MKPHYVRDYRRMVRNLLQTLPREEAMQRAVGGHYEFVGAEQLRVLREAGLNDSGFVIDVGCGSGRLAKQLAGLSSISYLGTDVVPELVDHAKSVCGRPDWQFEVVDGLTIPCRDATADVVCMFSVLTHLTQRESFTYLSSAARVMRPSGFIMVTFLERAPAEDRGIIREVVGRLRGYAVKTAYLTRQTMIEWGRELNLTASFRDPEEALGQSICIYRAL